MGVTREAKSHSDLGHLGLAAEACYSGRAHFTYKVIAGFNARTGPEYLSGAMHPGFLNLRNSANVECARLISISGRFVAWPRCSLVLAGRLQDTEIGGETHTKKVLRIIIRC